MNTLNPINPYAFNKPPVGNGTAGNETKPETGHVANKSNTGKTPNHKTDENETASKKPDKETIENTEISKFIGLIVKLENGIDKEVFSEKEIHQITALFSEKIESLPVKDKRRLEASVNYQYMQLDPDENFAEQTAEKILNGDKEQQASVFNFLKSKEFIAVLKDEPLTPSTFNPKELKTADGAKTKSDNVST